MLLKNVHICSIFEYNPPERNLKILFSSIEYPRYLNIFFSSINTRSCAPRPHGSAHTQSLEKKCEESIIKFKIYEFYSLNKLKSCFSYRSDILANSGSIAMKDHNSLNFRPTSKNSLSFFQAISVEN